MDTTGNASAGGSFTGSQVSDDQLAGQGIALADFNRDGHLDVVVTNRSGDRNHLYLGDGEGAFTPSHLSTDASESYAGAVGRIDVE